jgi:class 3 adenylate cyclase
MSLKQSGFLFIADVTGYTKFVASKELEHSNIILGNLLKSIVEEVRLIISIVKLEGDAVFGYLTIDKDRENTDLFKLIRTVYTKFRKEILEMSKNAPCGCQACSEIVLMDLKFFIHYGDFIIQDIAGIKDLFGNDVNILHRLTKNSLSEKTGWKGYLMMTGTAKDLLKVESELFELEESYSDVGSIKTYNLDVSALV